MRLAVNSAYYFRQLSRLKWVWTPLQYVCAIYIIRLYVWFHLRFWHSISVCNRLNGGDIVVNFTLSGYLSIAFFLVAFCIDVVTFTNTLRAERKVLRLICEEQTISSDGFGVITFIYWCVVLVTFFWFIINKWDRNYFNWWKIELNFENVQKSKRKNISAKHVHLSGPYVIVADSATSENFFLILTKALKFHHVYRIPKTIYDTIFPDTKQPKIIVCNLCINYKIFE